MTQAKKTLKERFFHAFLFEILAIGLCAPVAAWAMGKSLFEMGVLTAVIAWIALVWNMIYNAGFDRVENHYGFKRTMPVRVVHAFGFELGLILIVIPLAAWWLSISLWEAFVLDIALVLFYLPYAFLYNLAYDRSRPRVMAWLQRGKARPGKARPGKARPGKARPGKAPRGTDDAAPVAATAATRQSPCA